VFSVFMDKEYFRVSGWRRIEHEILRQKISNLQLSSARSAIAYLMSINKFLMQMHKTKPDTPNPAEYFI
jgi:hypothetical protein